MYGMSHSNVHARKKPDFDPDINPTYFLPNKIQL